MINIDRIPHQVLKAIKLLNEQNFEAFLVGGSVRDLLQNKIPADFDLATSATPEQILAVFDEYQTIPVGLKFGTILVVIEKMAIDITSFRTEKKYVDFRRPTKVQFSTSLKADLSRRDFTINALAFHPQTGLIDPFSGYQDLKNKIIRTVGQPQKRFNEDALRLLRALRFAARLNFTIEKATASAIHEQKHLLKNISEERINHEFCQIMLASGLKYIFVEFSDVLAVFIPVIKANLPFKQDTYDLFNQMIEVILNTPAQLDLRLAAFYYNTGKLQSLALDPEEADRSLSQEEFSSKIAYLHMQELKFSNKLIQEVEEILLHYNIILDLDHVLLKKYLHQLGYDTLSKIIILKKAQILAEKSKDNLEQISKLNQIALLLKEILKSKPVLQITDLKIDGHDALTAGFKGPEIGQALNKIFDLVLKDQLENKREPLLKALHDIEL